MTPYSCSCGHLRVQHCHGSGRCQMPRCGCLAGPPRPPLPEVLQAVPRVRARKVDGDGLVLEVAQSERKRLENMLWRRLEEAGLPQPEKEYRWARSEGRMYRSDGFYREPIPTLIEIDGGTWIGGGHTRGSAYEHDRQRDNLAALLGLRMLRFTKQMIASGEAVETIRRALTPALCDSEQLCLPR